MTTKRIGLTTFAIVALTRIADAVLANPNSYDQDDFIAEFESESEQERGCIAYHYIKLTKTARQLKNLVSKHRDWPAFTDTSNNPFYIAAKKDLKLTDEQAASLLGSSDGWPHKFYSQHANAKTPKGRARALANFIKFFIATDGTLLTAKDRKAAEADKARVEQERGLQRTQGALAKKRIVPDDNFDEYDDADMEEILTGEDAD